MARKFQENLKKKEESCFFYSFGYGEDHDDDLLNELSDIGNGVFSFIKNNQILDECILSSFSEIISVIGKDLQIEIISSDQVKVTDKLGTKWVDDQKTNEKFNKLYFP